MWSIRFPDGAQAVAAQYGAEVVTLDEAFASDAVHAFIIASSTDTHAPLLERCASSRQAGVL
ncbi:MAG: hypothetical protein R3E95_06120 [Thiolinea sp.]